MDYPIKQIFDTRDLIEYVKECQETFLQVFLDTYNDSIQQVQKYSIEKTEDVDQVILRYLDRILPDSDKEVFMTALGITLNEFADLLDFYDVLKNYSEDFQYGASVIREDYWVECCKELCIDIGDIPKDLPWYIANHINWEGVAQVLAIDYTSVSYDGKNYYIRK